jgi:hypothetical protein
MPAAGDVQRRKHADNHRAQDRQRPGVDHRRRCERVAHPERERAAPVRLEHRQQRPEQPTSRNEPDDYCKACQDEGLDE